MIVVVLLFFFIWVLTLFRLLLSFLSLLIVHLVFQFLFELLLERLANLDDVKVVVIKFHSSDYWLNGINDLKEISITYFLDQLNLITRTPTSCISNLQVRHWNQETDSLRLAEEFLGNEGVNELDEISSSVLGTRNVHVNGI